MKNQAAVLLTLCISLAFQQPASPCTGKCAPWDGKSMPDGWLASRGSARVWGGGGRHSSLRVGGKLLYQVCAANHVWQPLTVIESTSRGKCQVIPQRIGMINGSNLQGMYLHIWASYCTYKPSILKQLRVSNIRRSLALIPCIHQIFRVFPCEIKIRLVFCWKFQSSGKKFFLYSRGPVLQTSSRDQLS